jgi:hypothetical protein
MFLQDVIKENGLFLSPTEDRNQVLVQLSEDRAVGSDITLILLCSEDGDSLVDFIGRALALRPACRIIVVSQEPNCSGDLAIRWLLAGACNYVDISYPPGYLLDNMFGALSGNPPYMEQIQLPPVTGRSDLFVITPFEHPFALRDFHYGIVPACIRVFRRTPTRGDSRHDPSSVLDSVRAMIDNAKVVIANLSAYGGPPNANVYFEVGYTQGKWPHKLIPLMRRNEPVPSNFSGMKLVQYSGCADLALHLFHLLKNHPL